MPPLFGPYHPPRFRLGGFLQCSIRGRVRVTGVSSGRIAWPRCTVKGGKPLIVCGGLLRAIRRESSQAVMHWFGVGLDTAWKWRKALRVPKMNDGTTQLYRDLMPVHFNASAIAKRKKSLRSPERAAKIAAAQRGHKMPAHVQVALLKANVGRKLSAAHRRNLSEAHRRRRAEAISGGLSHTP